MEDYKKKYEDALERAKGAHNSAKSDKENGVTDICTEYTIQLTETIFPELKEGEEERIKEDIISLVNEFWERIGSINPEYSSRSKMIDWLKKQGEQKPALETKVIIPKFRVGDIVKSKSQPMLEPRKIISIGKDCYWCEDRGCIGFAWEDDCDIVEQKPADKVESKFKVGDWVVNKQDEIARINQVKEDSYGTLRYYIEFTDGNKTDPMPCFADEEFLLWAIQDAKDGDVLVSKIEGEPNNFIYIFNGLDGSKGFWSHCYLDAYVNNFHKGIYYHNNNNYGIPATKEQRELLFTKMKEAGYEWDSEKKELRKIEQKPTWSEEDERNLSIAIQYVFQHGYLSTVNWLKSLKERYTWNPSDEQMEALRIAAEIGTANNSWAMGILKIMYQDLKKLREE